MQQQIAEDLRIPQIINIVKSISISADMMRLSKIFITEDNIMIMVVDNTLIYTCKLNDCLPSFNLSIDYNKETSLISSDSKAPLPTQYFVEDYPFEYIRNTYINYAALETDDRLIARATDLIHNQEFFDLVSRKSHAPLELFKIPGKDLNTTALVPIYNAFPKIKKQDNIDISVYEIDNVYLMVVYDIYCKKINRNYKIYFRTLDLTK